MKGRRAVQLTVYVIACGVMACSEQPTDPASAQPSSSIAFARSKTPQPIPDEYIVVFKDAVQDVEGLSHRLVAAHAGTLRFVYTHAIKGFAAHLSAQAAAALAANPSIKYVEQNQRMFLDATQTSAPWGLDRVDDHSLPLNGTYTYPDGGGTGVHAYIIDSGIAFAHVDFGGRAITGFDVTPGGDASDCFWHGTFVAGILGGATYGVAKGVTLVSVRVSTNCQGLLSVATVIAGVDWVTANAIKPAVANISIAGAVSTTINQAVANLVASGVVAASDINDAFAVFSDVGSCVDIIAPGVNVRSDWFASTTATRDTNGTSFATPHVAGAAALYLANDPSATPATVKGVLDLRASYNMVSGIRGAGTPNKLLYMGFTTEPFSISIAGPTTAPQGANTTWSAVVQSGTPPFTYQWSGILYGTDSSITGEPGRSDDLVLNVWDSAGHHAATASFITLCPEGVRC